MPEIIRLPKMLRDAEVRAGSFDEAANTIEVIWTTGATGRRYSWSDGEFDEELVVSANAVRLDRLNAGAPFLDTHGTWSLTDILGSVVRGSAKISGGKGIATVKLSNAADAVDRVARIKEGTASNISVGYRIHAVERKEVDGKVPLHRVIDWEPWELSAVPIPFDPGAQVRSGAAPELFECRVERMLNNANARVRMNLAERFRRLG
ncbi:HK97 family phage prohead protease [Mesorhizobium captivum]|uniref:HK97 family phage prohead protease n=1 Tax=Mesorhizobium captivum TaxID=3072319 RepID=UPI002A23A831|nr:HK97 family phage prohead protease [Mesorhizobium sp. VK23E]MDX8513539.1 HK97 family phage prohead protease [Mesorhizobium sp. VK23E]